MTKKKIDKILSDLDSLHDFAYNRAELIRNIDMANYPEHPLFEFSKRKHYKISYVTVETGYFSVRYDICASESEICGIPFEYLYKSESELKDIIIAEKKEKMKKSEEQKNKSLLDRESSERNLLQILKNKYEPQQ